MRTVATYTTFKAWADTLPDEPNAADARRQFGCSNTTAHDWINRWQGQRVADPTNPALQATDRVFRALTSSTDPLTVRAVAQRTGLQVTAVIHAMQNLFEASRVLRHGQAKPFTYSVPSAMPDLSLLPAPQRRGALVASIGVPTATQLLWRIAA